LNGTESRSGLKNSFNRFLNLRHFWHYLRYESLETRHVKLVFQHWAIRFTSPEEPAPSLRRSRSSNTDSRAPSCLKADVWQQFGFRKYANPVNLDKADANFLIMYLTRKVFFPHIFVKNSIRARPIKL